MFLTGLLTTLVHLFLTIVNRLTSQGTDTHTLLTDNPGTPSWKWWSRPEVCCTLALPKSSHRTKRKLWHSLHHLRQSCVADTQSVNVDKTRSCTNDLDDDLQVSSARTERTQLSCCVFLCRQETLFVPSSRACPAQNNPNCVSLSDLLHEVPRLWDFTPSKYWNVLLGFNTEVRRQVQGMIRCIKITEALQPEQLHHLTKGGWSQLRCLDLSKSCITAASHAQLSNGAWPLLQNLTLARGRTFDDLSSCSEHVFRQFEGKWPLLESLTVSGHRLDVAQVTALTDIDWPLLQILCIEPFHDAIPALMKGNWLELKDLSIQHGLDYRGLGCWSNLPWSTLQRLQLRVCQVSPNGIHSLIQAHLPQLQEFLFVYDFWKSEGEDSEDCFAMLAQAK